MKSLEFDIESLEQRKMLAGNVSAVVTGGGDLRITGDDGDNEVVIRATNDADGFIIEGLNGTTINGGTLFEVHDITDDFRINLKDGKNLLALSILDQDQNQHSFAVPDDLSFKSGDGDDLVVLDSLDITIGGKLRIATGDGDDAVFVKSNIAGQFTANTGSGNDWLDIRGNVGGRTNVAMGSGDDVMVSVVSVFADRVRVRLGDGQDIVCTHDVLFEADAKLDGNRNTDAWYDCISARATFNEDNDIRFELTSGLTDDDLLNEIDSQMDDYARAEDRFLLPPSI